MLTYITNECMPLEKMLARVEKQHPGGESAQLVKKAYEFAENAHMGQVRKSGEPYFIHPVSVASILTDLMIDATTIAAGFLHDTVEDCPEVTLETIRAEFGDEVAQLVDGVTKLDKLDFTNREEQQAESLRKMILAMSKDIRVVIIKLADRLHNMRTLRFQAENRQRAIAHETLDIYAPLAHRLGMGSVKSELEDLSFKYIDPEAFHDIAQKVGLRRTEREENIRMVISELSEKLDKQGIRYDMDGRPKHLYSIYKKMHGQGKSFDQIYDLIAVRVMVDTVQDCYTVLGIVHTLWNQIPGRFKDYISVPKGNMYQSLHTTVIGGRKMPFPFEIQIRTWEMHRLAEYGVAAHWRYKEGSKSGSLDDKLYWLRQILDWQGDTRDSKEFIDSLKTDLFSEEVLLFTPKGDIISMQRGATPIDFAYRIHSGVGNKCVGAKVNGRIVPLETELQTGDRVEIITSSNSKGPSNDWLRIVKTQQAKSKIRQFLKRELKGENVQKGRDMLEHEAKRRGVDLYALTKPEYYEGLLKRYAFAELNDIYGAVGYGGIASAYVISRLLEEQHKAETAAAPKVQEVSEEEVKAQLGKPSHGIYVKGESGMLVRFARCCNPLPGDEIIGYITRGRGVTVHKADCSNMQNEAEERLVEVSWADPEANAEFNASINIVAYDHVSLLGELAMTIGNMDIPIVAASAKRHDRKKTSIITVVVQVKSREQLDRLIKQIQKRSDVVDVYRSAN
ncbi:MAG: bifunctional (p)ppGpp synthetase/guanosine-3',5'-bis(diphosphate) 3'-pyrophosphohydrolase [Clostridiales bacterium]|nr:bifunctional (p)ppGpp synthetase/guanosine-3',5'-bis(diphosphate) 3'-pyrophosphohydrolase [Clostridiales bacterium]